MFVISNYAQRLSCDSAIDELIVIWVLINRFKMINRIDKQCIWIIDDEVNEYEREIGRNLIL